MRYAALILLMLSISCKSQKDLITQDNRLQLLVRDNYFPVNNREAFIINDAKSLRSLYAKVNRTRKPGLPIPIIDFTTHSVLVAYIGENKNSSFPIMQVVKETETSIKITVIMKKGNEEATASSFPFCLYAMQNDGKKLILELE